MKVLILNLLFLLILVFGCASLTELAPPVETLLGDTATASSAERAALEHGRQLYIRDCAKCHSPVAVNSLSHDQWETVLPEMVQSTGLDKQAEQDLSTYIKTVLKSGQ